MSQAVVEENLAPSRTLRPTTAATALAALGIVYGDLGTSPLYTLQTLVHTLGTGFSPDIALGVLSLIFWALVVTISVKYALFVMRADNHGEGGILALMPLAGASRFENARVLVVMGLFGAALLYGDGIITPAISVLSALEGVNIATDNLAPYVMPLAVVILVGLFAVQGRGTARIGALFGPVMLLWFVTIGALGVGGIWRHPQVLAAVDPRYAIGLLASDFGRGFTVLGGVFLAITGGEALYADMGHLGRNPIRTSWYGIVLPALLLCYAGQTALIIEHGGRGVDNPFFLLAPSWAIYPLVALATAATIIASQAIITGSFSLTRQAMQLGWSPGLRIHQTSDVEYGQIYVPFVNWTMMVLTVMLTIGFGSSDRLAGAYGTAVSTTMLLTTALLYKVMRTRWHWPAAAAVAASGVFLTVDLAFFSANLLKIAEGGWIPLGFGAVVFTLMLTWHSGLVALQRKQAALAQSPVRFHRMLTRRKIPRVPGTAIFLTRMSGLIPPQVIRHVEQFGAIPQTLIALTVSFADLPRIDPARRVDLRKIADGLWEMTVRYGFVEIPDLPAALRGAKARGCPVDFAKAIYFSARDRVVRDRTGRHLARWQLPVFSFLVRNSVRAVDLFNLPPQNVVEIARQIEL